VDPAISSSEEREVLGINTRLPDSLEEALDALREDKVLRNQLGDRLVREYIEVKERELLAVQARGKDWYRKWY
jgi:glutamine synthetase